MHFWKGKEEGENSRKENRREEKKEKLRKEKFCKNFFRNRLVFQPPLDAIFSLDQASFAEILISTQTRILIEQVSFRNFLQKPSRKSSNSAPNLLPPFHWCCYNFLGASSNLLPVTFPSFNLTQNHLQVLPQMLLV